MTISEAEMPSLVALVCATAGRQVSTTAPAAKPNVLNDLDIDVSSPWGPYGAKGGAFTPSLLFKQDCSSHRPRRIHRVDFGGITLVHEAALQLHGRRQLLVLRSELAFDQIESLDGLDAGEIGIDRFDLAPDQVLDLRRATEAGIIRKGDVVVLREFLDILLVDHHEAGEVWPLVADHHGIRDVGRELQLVLDLGRRDVLAARRDDDVLHPVGDLDETFIVDRADVAGVQPAPGVDGFGGLLRLIEVTHEQEIALDQDFALRGNRNLAPGRGLADRTELDAIGRHHGGHSAILGLAVDLAHVEAEREIPADQIRRDRRRTGEGEPAT